MPSPASPPSAAPQPPAPTPTPPKPEAAQPVAAAQESKQRTSFIGFLGDLENVKLMLLAIVPALGKRPKIKYAKACDAVKNDVAPGAPPKSIGALMRELARQGYVEISVEKEKKEICLSAKGYDLLGAKPDVLAAPAVPVAVPQQPAPRTKASDSIGETIELIRTRIEACDKEIAGIDEEMRVLKEGLHALDTQASKLKNQRVELERTVATLQQLS